MFDDIALPMTITAARADGFTEFMGMTIPDRRFEFGGQSWKVLSAPVIKAVVAGWSMNTYIEPASLNGQVYRDGGGTFYDPSLLVACLDPELTNLIDIHLDYPESGTENLPYKPDLPRIILDTHNYTFPEEQAACVSLPHYSTIISVCASTQQAMELNLNRISGVHGSDRIQATCRHTRVQR